VRYRAIPIIVPVFILTLVGSATPGQRPQQSPGPTQTRSATFNPRDLAGVWERDRGHRSINESIPPMTPEGEARLKLNIPARGRPLGEALNGEHFGRVRAVIPALSNDPMMACNPPGFPRLLLDPEPVEFVQTDGRLLQLFQWTRTLRELWTDGRAVPFGENLENLGPAWYGHSVGRWEGDTLVVQTVGLDDRAWIDIFGFPKSVEARFEERYRRIDADTIELRMTMWDPRYYKEPWVSDVKTFNRTPREDVTYFGWYGLFGGITDAICAPMNEVEDFNKRIRNPAGLGVQGQQ
jgi:hypothetical protein